MGQLRDETQETDDKIGTSARRLLAVLLLTIETTLTGCTSGLDLSHCPMIWGRVTRHGEPVNDVLVVYTPEAEGSTAPWAVSPVEANGSYRMIANDQGGPLITGWYKINLVLNHPNNVSTNNADQAVPTETKHKRKDYDDPSSISESKTGQPSQDGTANKKADSQASGVKVPPAYLDYRSTPLKLWVRAQTMQVDIDLLD